MYCLINSQKNINLSHLCVLMLAWAALFLLPSTAAANNYPDKICWTVNSQSYPACFNDSEYTDDDNNGLNKGSAINQNSDSLRLYTPCTSNQNCTDWKLTLVDATHNGVTADDSAYRLQAKVGNSNTDAHWRPGDSFSSTRNNKMTSSGLLVDLKLHMNANQTRRLQGLEHAFSFRLRAESKINGQWESKDLFYTFQLCFQPLQGCDPDSGRTIIQITGLDTIDFGTFSADDSPVAVGGWQHSLFCVYVQDGSNFKIKATSFNNGFVLKNDNDNSHTTAYQVKLLRTDKTNEQDSIAYDRVYPFGAGDTRKDCERGDNMQLSVKLSDSIEHISTLPAGYYFDLLTLTVTPE